LSEHFENIKGIIHCSGGGQTKCLKYLPGPMKVIKNNLFDPPPVFDLIKEASGADLFEMLQVFNMGSRMEIYTDEKTALSIIDISNSFQVDAQIIGHVETADQKSLEVILNEQSYNFKA
jgi:phosphoribosylformylglycinamidine cyclo-ligase